MMRNKDANLTALSCIVVMLYSLMLFLLGYSCKGYKLSKQPPKTSTITIYKDSVVPVYEYQTIDVPKEFKKEIKVYDTINIYKDSTIYKDSLIVKVVEIADTSSIVKDWQRIRHYNEIVNVNSCPLNLKATIQHNLLTSYSITGECRPSVVYKQKPFTLTSLVGYNSLGNISLEGIMNIKNLAVGCQMELRNEEKPVSTFKIGYTF